MSTRNPKGGAIAIRDRPQLLTNNDGRATAIDKIRLITNNKLTKQKNYSG
jgi:hypothetical protein